MPTYRKDIDCANCHVFGEWRSATPAYQSGFNDAYLTYKHDIGRTIWCRDTLLDSPDDICITPCVNCLWYDHNCVWEGRPNYGTDYESPVCEYTISTCKCVTLSKEDASHLLIDIFERANPPVPFDAWVDDCVPTALVDTVIHIHEQDISDTETIIEY